MYAKQALQSIVVMCALGAASLVQAQGLIASDEFEYPSTPNLYGANGGAGWASQWFKLSNIPTGVTPDGLTWPGLLTRGGCASTAPFPTADFTRYSRAVATYVDPDDTVYISFLIRPNPGFGMSAGLAFGTWDNGMVVGARPTGVYGLMTPPDTARSDTKMAVVQGETSLLVTRVRKNSDATVSWSLYVNPPVSNSEPAVPDAVLTVPGTMLPPAIMIYNDGGFSTDEIRLGHIWSSVLPQTILGDIIGDGVVNVADLLAVIQSWGVCPASCAADLNGDGRVDVADLILVIAHWG